MKIYGLFKQEMFTPFLHECLIDVYAQKADADSECTTLNNNNDRPMEEDDYGPIRGRRYFVAELEVK
jgi:hypothetical protein